MRQHPCWNIGRSFFRRRPRLRCFSKKLSTERKEELYYRIMAPPKRKTRGRTGKERIIGARYFHRQHRKRPALPRQVQAHSPINVPELVYRLLNGNKHNQGGRGSRGTGEFREKMRIYQNHREPSYDTVSLRDSSVSMDGSGYTKSVTTSVENLSRVMEATNSSGTTGSENSSVSNVSVKRITLANSIDNTRALLKKKSLVQIINNYIKAGIEEGKRQAKKYIRKAISFGVKSGYLIPADPQGQVIRVSPMLAESRRSAAESRKKRRRARKGEDEEPFGDRKERRRGTPPLATKRKPRREVTPELVVPRKRRKTSPSRNPRREVTPKLMVPRRRRKTSASRNPRTNFNATERIDKKKNVGRGGKAGTKKINTATTKKKDKVMYSKISVSPKKSEENVRRQKREETRERRPRNRREEVIGRKENHRGRTTTSPFVRKVGTDNARKDHQDSSDEDSTRSNENEVHQRAVIEHRKSTSHGGEVLPAEENESPGNPDREMEENLEPLSIEEMNENNVVQDSI